jgi:hypothetical protein
LKPVRLLFRHRDEIGADSEDRTREAALATLPVHQELPAKGWAFRVRPAAALALSPRSFCGRVRGAPAPLDLPRWTDHAQVALVVGIHKAVAPTERRVLTDGGSRSGLLSAHPPARALGARDRTCTCMGYEPAAFSTLCVYWFRHSRKRCARVPQRTCLRSRARYGSTPACFAAGEGRPQPTLPLLLELSVRPTMSGPAEGSCTHISFLEREVA